MQLNRLVNIFDDNDPRKIEFEQLCAIIPRIKYPDFVKDSEEAMRIWCRYILDKDNNVIMVEQHIYYVWLRIVGDGRRIVKQDIVNDCGISTVFLTMDASIDKKGPLEVFETMCFSKGITSKYGRYATWQEAVDGHKEAVKAITQLA